MSLSCDVAARTAASNRNICTVAAPSVYRFFVCSEEQFVQRKIGIENWGKDKRRKSASL